MAKGSTKITSLTEFAATMKQPKPCRVCTAPEAIRADIEDALRKGVSHEMIERGLPEVHNVSISDSTIRRHVRVCMRGRR